MFRSLIPRSRISFAAALFATLAAPHLAAQGYPNRPITLAVPFASGANVEILFRAMSQEVGAMLGQPVIVENRPGGNFRLPAVAVRKAAPDGYFLAGTSEAVLVTQAIGDPGFQVEPGRDYAPVVLLMSFPLVVVANPSVPFRDIRGLIEFARANPGKLNMGIGQGGSSHTVPERMRTTARVEWTNIPYKEGGLVMPDLLQGRIDLTVTGSLAKPSIDAGKLVALGTTGPARWSLFPHLPTLRESGVDMHAVIWFGIVAPAGTPADIVRRLNSAYRDALKSPATAKRLADFGMTPGNLTPEAFESLIRSEISVWTPIIKAAGIRFD